MDYVRVVVPAHLHAGNLDLCGDMGRLYGTVGFTVGSPRVVARVERSDRLESGDPHALRALASLRPLLGGRGARVVVESGYPPYSGLGYVTGLYFAVALGVSELYGLGLSLEEAALALRRGLVTALGLYAAKVGGFIVEGGFRRGMREREVPPLVFRGEIPERGLFVVALPYGPLAGIQRFRESAEERALAEVSEDCDLASRLSRLVLMRMLPSFAEGDLGEFGAALTEFNRSLGQAWARYQGGTYCCPLVERGIEILLRRVYGAAQSSWGPAFYGLTDDEAEAERAAAELREYLREHGGGDVLITRGRNRGAEVAGPG